MSRRSARGKPETGDEIPAKQLKLAEIDDDGNVEKVESVPDENEPPKPVVVGDEATSEAEKESAADDDAKSVAVDAVDAADGAGDKLRFRILRCAS